jgi:hypothetical protein
MPRMVVVRPIMKEEYGNTQDFGQKSLKNQKIFNEMLTFLIRHFLKA